MYVYKITYQPSAISTYYNKKPMVKKYNSFFISCVGIHLLYLYNYVYNISSFAIFIYIVAFIFMLYSRSPIAHCISEIHKVILSYIKKSFSLRRNRYHNKYILEIALNTPLKCFYVINVEVWLLCGNS